jgi:hypothetical protein
MSFILQPWQLLVLILAGWVNREQQEIIELCLALTSSASSRWQLQQWLVDCHLMVPASRDYESYRIHCSASGRHDQVTARFGDLHHRYEWRPAA